MCSAATPQPPHCLEGSCTRWTGAWTLARSQFSSLEGTESDTPCLANTLMGGDVYSGCFWHQAAGRLVFFDFSSLPIARCSLVHLLNLDGPWGGFRRKLLPVKPVVTLRSVAACFWQ